MIRHVWTWIRFHKAKWLRESHLNRKVGVKDIRTMIQHDNNTLDTKQTLRDLQGMMGIIDQFFPTQSLPSQIAGIDRAVDSQVAAVQQGSNRRQQKGARLIDESMLRPMRCSMYYNIVQFQAGQCGSR
jgi:hypothetical protein